MPPKTLVPCSNCTAPCVPGIHADKDHGGELCPMCNSAIYGRRSKIEARHKAVEKKLAVGRKPGVAKLTYINQGPPKAPVEKKQLQGIPATSEFDGLAQIAEKHIRRGR